MKTLSHERYLSYLVLGLVGESGEVAEKIKKVIRDNEGVLDKERRDDLEKELGDVLWYLSRLAEVVDSSLSDIAQKNIEKLHSRLDRGVLQGDGDNR